MALQSSATTDVNTPDRPNLTEAISGIVTDFQMLVSQQLELVRAEVRRDWGKAKHALRPVTTGTAFIAVAAILLGFSSAFALHWLLSPPGNDPARLPLWACFSIAAAVFGAMGIVLVRVGLKAFESFNPLPDESAAALEQNLKALVDRRSSAVPS